VAGCIPIYYGAPNVADYVPPNSIVDIAALGGPAETAAELARLAAGPAALAAKHAWRSEPEKWGPGFRKLVVAAAAAERGEWLDDDELAAAVAAPLPPPGPCAGADPQGARQCLICQAVAGETREERGEGRGGGAARAILTPNPPSLPLFTDWQAAGEEEYDEEEGGEDAFALRRRR
jgi:hypothetical protein